MLHPLNHVYSPGDLISRVADLDRLTRRLSRPGREVTWFSAPGRVELIGNHTDHNGGQVLAASVQLDSLAAAVPLDNQKVQVASEGFSPVEINCRDLAPREREKGTSAALVRGILAYFKKQGYRVGGLQAAVSSRVSPGSGLSSSASFQALIAGFLNRFYHRGKLPGLELARAGQFAENRYFGKPCGLMDQLACITGGLAQIDFRNPAAPRIRPVDFSFEKHGFSLMILNTGGNHVDLTGEYATIPREMKAVAAEFKARNLREVRPAAFHQKLPQLRERCADRPLLRSLHFFAENRRVRRVVTLMKEGAIGEILPVVQASGDSSWKLLQNIYPGEMREHQPLALALALAQEFFDREGSGACRVHGGGFAGTVLILLPRALSEKFIRRMEGIFSPGCCTALTIRRPGLVTLAGENSAS